MSVTLAALRRHVVAARGTRPATGSPARTTSAADPAPLGRAARLDLGRRPLPPPDPLSRVGRLPAPHGLGLLANGRVFEYWAHEACLLPIEDWPLVTSRMLSRPDHPWWGDVIDREPALADRVMGEIRERGPLGSRHFEGPRSAGGMWGLKPAKRMLEHLWSAGQARRSPPGGFQRMYDLPERVIPGGCSEHRCRARTTSSRARAPGRRGPRRAHRRRSRRALAPAGRGSGREALHSTRSWAKDRSARRGRRRRRAGGAASRRAPRVRLPRSPTVFRPPLARSTTCCGTGPFARARARLPAT